MTADLEALYRVFARYPLRERIEGCPCCVQPGEDRVLHDRPLRDLGAEDLRRYAAKALTTWGDDRDFRHFLPRILELVDELGYPGPDVVLGKLPYAGWREWPADEQAAIEAFVAAWWQRRLATYPAGDVAMSLGALAHAGFDLAPFLAAWPDTEPAMLHLAELVSAKLRRWPEAARAQVAAFVAGAAARLERAFFAATDPDAQRALSDAHAIVLITRGRDTCSRSSPGGSD